MLQNNQPLSIDFDQGIRSLGSRDTHIRYLLRFTDDDTYVKLRTCVAIHDWRQAFHYAHTLKGLSAQLCLAKVFESCSSLCELLRNPDFVNEYAVSNQFVVLAKAYSNAVRLIKMLV